MNIKNPKQSLLLPDEIIEEIFSRLPAKSLKKFRCVSKFWHSVIDSKRFIKIHLQNSRNNTAFPYHQVILNYRRELKQCSLQSMIDESTDDPSPFDDTINNLFDIPSILGCFNGLVCVLNRCRLFFLWNPSTRIFKELPEAHHGDKWFIKCSGFGWDESNDDYKLFAIVFVYANPEHHINKVYSSKTNAWKTIEQGYLLGNGKFVANGKYVGGNLHWHNTGENIVCFEFKSEVFGTIEPPFHPETSPVINPLGVVGGCLSMIYIFPYTSVPVDIWVMKEYGVKESWLKLVTVDHVRELVERPFSALFALGQNGEILVSGGTTLFVYYPEYNMFGFPNRFEGAPKEFVYVESLVSP